MRGRGRGGLRAHLGRGAAAARAGGLGAAYPGGTSLAELGAAGLVEQLRPGALQRASMAFRGVREPFYPGGWAFPLY